MHLQSAIVRRIFSNRIGWVFFFFLDLSIFLVRVREYQREVFEEYFANCSEKREVGLRMLVVQ